jgi:hypothetical protein
MRELNREKIDNWKKIFINIVNINNLSIFEFNQYNHTSISHIHSISSISNSRMLNTSREVSQLSEMIKILAFSQYNN